MTLEPQKAPTNKEEAASEERQHQTKDNQQEVQSEVKETTKKRTKTGKTAQQQHQAQPEVVNVLPGLNETLAPAEPGAEGDVRGRRIADEFTLNVSDAALLHIGDRPSDYMRRVKEEAYERIYAAERMLCGHIVVIGNVPPVDMTRWWRPFPVDDLWFVLEPRQDYIREYCLMPSFGPSPDDLDETPPHLRRQQSFAPPDHIGPRRRRARRNRGDAKSTERNPQPQPKTKGKKKRSDVKRIINELYNLAAWELELHEEEFLHSLAQSWRQTKPRLLRSVVRMRRFGQVCGSVLHYWRGALASFVQETPISTAFSNPDSKTLTQGGERAPETFGPSGCLEPSSAGQTISQWLRLYSWKWDQPPVPWAEYLFGVDWTLNIFGAPEEEQAFT